MTKNAVYLLETLIGQMGCKAYKRWKKPCVGKYRGTYDYGVTFDNGLDLFISNGPDGFEARIRGMIGNINTMRLNREKYIMVIGRRLEEDNRLSGLEGMNTVKLLDVGVNLDMQDKFLWNYLLVEVAGKTFRFTETSLSRHLANGTVEKWIGERPINTFTAGAVEHPDHIIGNVRFSSTDSSYKIR